MAIRNAAVAFCSYVCYLLSAFHVIKLLAVFIAAKTETSGQTDTSGGFCHGKPPVNLGITRLRESLATAMLSR